MNITVVVPTFNESENIGPLIDVLMNQIAVECEMDHGAMLKLLIIDNFSTDGTREIIEERARSDRRIMAILNRRNFGQLRSPVHGILRAPGDAVVMMAADFQDPPQLIPRMISEYRRGKKIVACAREGSDEKGLLPIFRTIFYRILTKTHQGPVVKNLSSFALIDRDVIESIRNLRDPVPFFRTLYFEFGYPYVAIPFHQPKRRSGHTKNNLLSLLDYSIYGLTDNTKTVMRGMMFLGVALAMLSMLGAFYFLILKLVYWNQFTLGTIPAIISMFFILAVILFFLGIIGEYQLRTLEYLKARPLVYEERAINID